MRTRRAISINNSLVHGICNYDCIICGINKASYSGPKAYQSVAVVNSLIKRIREAGKSGIRIRNMDISGDGEPTLHPEFPEIMDRFGDLNRNWEYDKIPKPKISLVTNGFYIAKKNILPILEKNGIRLRISFPTPVPEHYGKIVVNNESRGRELLNKVIPGIKQAMTYAAEGRIPKLTFHISPPFLPLVKDDFSDTIDSLTTLAKSAGLTKIHLDMFPGISNRVGAVKKSSISVETYKASFKKYNNSFINGIQIKMVMAHKHFFQSIGDFTDLLLSFKYPCLWYGNIFLSPEGDSCCCNDQSLEEKRGNIRSDSLQKIIELKESKRYSEICAKCNSTPKDLLNLKMLTAYHTLANLKINYA
jgi:hypothetical protein